MTELARFRLGLRQLSGVRGEPTVATCWDAWLRDRAEDGLPNKVYGYNWLALAPHFGHLLPSQVDKTVCKAYAKRRLAKSIKPWTVWTEMTRLRACLKWAAGAGRKIDSPVHVWVLPKGESRKTTINIEDLRKLLEAAGRGRPHSELFVVLVITTAQRHKAICDLTWDRVDFAGGMIHFDDQKIRDPRSRSWRKGRASVPMNTLSRLALERACEGRLTDHVIEHGGKRLQAVRDGFKNAVKRAGLEGKITPHTIRHSVATILDELGHDVTRIRELLAHKPGSKVTQSTYIHPDAGKVLQDAVRVLDLTPSEKKLAIYPERDTKPAKRKKPKKRKKRS